MQRLRWPLSAVVVGTMSPDFEYLIHLRPLALWSHGVIGLFIFCLPAGLLVLLAWERVVQAPVRHLLALDGGDEDHSSAADSSHARGPRAGVAATTESTKDASWWRRAAVAIVVGAATHLAWDSFTHDGYVPVRQIAWLRSAAFSAGGVSVPWYNMLQHASTVAGGVVVLVWLSRTLHAAGAWRTIVRSPWRLGVFGAIALGALAAGVWNAPGLLGPSGYGGSQVLLGRAAVAALLALGLGLFVYGCAWSAARTLAPRER
jgi:hypothetical protein